MWFRTTADYDSLTSLWAAGDTTKMVLAQDFRHMEFSIFSSSVTTWHTITVYCSDQEDRPDLTSAVSTTNRYAAVQVIPKINGAAIDWDTGIVITSDGHTKYEINDNKSRWVGLKIDTGNYTDWTSDVTINLADNQ
jgi:hypothetical protein